MGLLDNKVALITGAGGGIGRSHALLFAREGAAVVVNDLGVQRDGTGADTSAAAAVVREITDAGGRAVASTDSVATAEGAQAMVDLAVSRFGGLDIVINNAGILRDRTLLKMSDEEWDDVLAVHLRGTFLCCRAAGRVFKAQGRGGRIINTSSVSGLKGNIGQANYGAAKAGIAGLTFTLAKELARYDVTVNALAPIALTRMTKDLAHHKEDSENALNPDHVAPVALFFASERSREITGRILGIEGSKLYEYEVVTTDGVTLPDNQAWDVDTIANRWDDIVR